MGETFESIRADIEHRLCDGADNRKSAMHTPVVATHDADMRVMVLREFDKETWTLRFHTDARSPKVETIGKGAPVGVLFYDPEAKVQIRCRGTGMIEGQGPAADAAWEESTTFARRCYLGAAPGEERDEPSSGLPDWIEGDKPSEEQVAPFRENFAMLLVKVDEIDWYWLSNEGHRRALIRQEGARWLTP